MQNRIVWLGGVLILCAALAAWLLRGSSSELAEGAASADRGEQAAAARPAPARVPSTPPSPPEAAAAQLQPKTNGGPAPAAARSEAPQAAKPRARQSRDVEFIAKLFQPPGPSATDQERLFWDESPVSDLLYPTDHPCAGAPRDSVSPAQLTQAGNEALGKQIDNLPNVDAEQCHLAGNWAFHPLNQAYAKVNLDDPQTVLAFIDEMASMPQDPNAYPASIWLPCPGRSDATTMREFFQGLVADQVEQVFSGPPCTAR
jgi:hypothetical protein